MFRAMRTEHWWQLESQSQETLPPVPVPDHLAIRWFENELRAEDQEWKRYFEVFSITPFTVVYEELIAEPPRVMRNILDWLGLSEVPTPQIKPRLARQSNPASEQDLSEYLTIRDSLPAKPPGWQWSFHRRAFGWPDQPPAGVPQTTPTIPSTGDLSPL